MVVVYGKTVDLGNGSSIGVSGCLLKHTAILKAAHIAVHAGWKPRRWWQVWRKCDPMFEAAASLSEEERLSRIRVMEEQEQRLWDDMSPADRQSIRQLAKASHTGA